ncbi:MAG: hypothetical protein ACK58T_36510, partial [Phycisphaerae bacterium]
MKLTGRKNHRITLNPAAETATSLMRSPIAKLLQRNVGEISPDPLPLLVNFFFAGEGVSSESFDEDSD